MYVKLEYQGVFVYLFFYLSIYLSTYLLIYLFISEIIHVGLGLHDILSWVSLCSLKKLYPNDIGYAHVEVLYFDVA